MKEARDVVRLLDRLGRCRVLVYGDLVCDVYHHTEIERVSREAPVLITRHRRRELRAGGAANAARNVASLGGRAAPVGVVGADEAGEALLGLLRRDRARLEGVLEWPRYSTPTKTRILAGGAHSVRQQVLRIDDIDPVPRSRALAARLERALEGALRNAGAVLVSDYGLGTVRKELVARLFEKAARKGIPRLVDSRHRLGCFPGATLATPNEPEMEEIAGRPLAGDPGALRAAGKALIERIGLEALVVTQGSDGMTVIGRDGEAVHVPVFGADEIADVTGAGDTVAAALALALAAGADPLAAARLATVAAGLVVMKQGTSTVTRREIAAALS